MGEKSHGLQYGTYEHILSEPVDSQSSLVKGWYAGRSDQKELHYEAWTMSRCAQWQDHDAPQPFSLSKALLDLVSTQSGYPWRVLLRLHMCSHMDNICPPCGGGQSSLIEGLSQLRVMFSQLVFRIHSGTFIVDWARRFLSFSPTLTTEVGPQTGGLVRNSTAEGRFSKANPFAKNISIKCAVGFLSTFGSISHIECY